MFQCLNCNFLKVQAGDWNIGRDPLVQNFPKFRYRMKWNGNFRKVRFENFGHPLEVVTFPRNLEFRKVSTPFGISGRHSVLKSQPWFSSKDGRVKSLSISVQHLFCLRIICRSFDGICAWMTMGILHRPMLPSVSRKQSGTTWTVSLNAHTSLHMTVKIVLVGSNSVI